MGGAWVFGYGSLVAPASLAKTIGREVDPDVDVVVASLAGFGRRWNYGSMHLRGDWHHEGVDVRRGVVVSLGLEAASDESCNGVIVRVTADELAALDWRERDYQRTDVTDLIEADANVDGPIVTYVPNASSIERYQAARDAGRAAIRRTYWDLVREAFASLGQHHLHRYEVTPAPDVPVADIALAAIDPA
jgi:dephospho-CoA kinase